MTIEIMEGGVFCQYCNIWQDVSRIKFSKEGIDVECKVCGTTMSYNIKQEE